jgi:hypothetical protein
MIAALRRRRRARRTLAFAAVLALLLQAIPVGAGSFLGVPPLADASASSHDGHSEHHTPGDPAKPRQAHPCGWCILCGKLGVALGAPAAPVGVLTPEAGSATLFTPAARVRAVGQTSAVFPLGARAPPRLA